MRYLNDNVRLSVLLIATAVIVACMIVASQDASAGIAATIVLAIVLTGAFLYQAYQNEKAAHELFTARAYKAFRAQHLRNTDHLVFTIMPAIRRVAVYTIIGGVTNSEAEDYLFLEPQGAGGGFVLFSSSTGLRASMESFGPQS